MLRAIINHIPFQHIVPSISNKHNHIPRQILNEIAEFIRLERLYYPNKPPIYNTVPFLTIARNNSQSTLENIPFPEHKPLARINNTHLVSSYIRDLSVYNNAEMKLLISRGWFNYDQQTRFIKILCVYEVFDYHAEFATYIRNLTNSKCQPDFNAKDYSNFLKQLQALHY